MSFLDAAVSAASFFASGGDWRARLLPASFRGAPFHVDIGANAVGRRTATHEFIKRDTPYAEDMGRRAKRFTITGHVVGDDYFDQRDALIAALETEGAGTLVHPSMGELQVNVDGPCNIIERFVERGRVADFELSFVEAGSADATTTPTQDTAAAVTTAATAADTAAVNSAQIETGFGGSAVVTSPQIETGFGGSPIVATPSIETGFGG